MTHNILDQLDRRRHFERGNGNDIIMYGRGKKEYDKAGNIYEKWVNGARIKIQPHHSYD